MRGAALAVALVALVVALALGRSSGPDAQRAVSPVVPACTRTEDASVARLLRSLRPGDVGCLRAGTYREDVTFDRSDVTLRSSPGERALIQGRFWVTRASRHARITDLDIDGRNARDLPSPTVNGRDATFARVDVTNHHTGICFLLGSPGYGRAVGTRIEASRIHDCGRLPATNYDHGIYVSMADRTTISGNVIVDNADRGIQLYPDAQGTRVVGNVVVGNGEGLIFGGEGRRASSGTLVTGNVLAGSRLRHDVESYYGPGGRRGSRNVVQGNCLHGGQLGAVDRSGGGFRLGPNTMVDPGLGPDLAVPLGSPCAKLLGTSPAARGIAGVLQG